MKRGRHRRGRPARRLMTAALLGAVALLAPAAAAQASYDLSVTIASDSPLSFDDQDLSWSQQADWTIAVVNNGPDPAPASTLTVNPPGTASGSDCTGATLTSSSVQCSVPPLDPGGSFNALVASDINHSDLASDRLAPATASIPCSSPPESDCANDSASASAQIAFAPHVRISAMRGRNRPRSRLVLRGSATAATTDPGSAVARIQVAVLRRRAGRCLWLNSHAGFTPTPADAGSCDRPVWLDATGTTAWTFAIAHGLNRGRYSAYARATSASGSPDLTFGPRRGNAATIVVG